MYPKPFMDLQGWNIRHMAAGNTHYAVAADTSCITWYSHFDSALRCILTAQYLTMQRMDWVTHDVKGGYNMFGVNPGCN